MAYVATFFSHFGATRFRRLCASRGVAAELMPVPRAISSSCGTCARFDTVPFEGGEPWPAEVERVVEVSGTGAAARFETVYLAKGC